MANRLRRLTDLFVDGMAVKMPDGTHIWVQALNAYQRDECISDAQVARARLVMALRQNGDERTKIEGRFYEHGRDWMINDLAKHRATRKMADYVDEMRADPEWKERMDILMRTDTEDTAAVLKPEEVELLATINQQIMEEMSKRENDEIAFLEEKFHRMTDDEVIDEWTEDWLDTKGGENAEGEYRLTEAWYATRWCNATTNGDGELDHTDCDGHTERVFADRQAVREVGNELLDLIRSTLGDLNMVGRDPKGSGSNQSSSSSLPTPSEPETSPPSTSPDAQS